MEDLINNKFLQKIIQYLKFFLKTIVQIQYLLKIIVDKEGEKLKEKDDGFFDSMTIIIDVMKNIIKFKDMKDLDHENIQNIF